jgi:NAD(P)-dependent dehydrogenase (short-subunit alcohol dehydrogenase family)
MVSRRRGRIINVSSGGGTMAIPFFSSYVCGKTAVIRFTECLAIETKPYGIAVFSISPGTVRTAMSEYSLNSPEGKKWLPWFKRIFDEGLVVPPERPAELVLELASGRADSLSGRFLSIYDDLGELLKSVADLEQKNLYALKVERLAAPPNPAMASILAAARKPE